MVQLADRVKETTATTGTGTYNLAGAVSGFQGFVAGVGSTSKCYYTVTNGTDWEVGIGTVTDSSPDTLSRDIIIASSNSGAAVNWVAGNKDVFISVPATGQRRVLNYVYQTTGTSFPSFTVPANTLKRAGDILEIEILQDDGTSGNVTSTMTFGGGTVFAIGAFTPSNRVHWRVRIGYITATTVWFSWAWESSAANNDCDSAETLTVSSLTAGAALTFAITGGTAPEARVMTVEYVPAPF
jgi:hypothetical protein